MIRRACTLYRSAAALLSISSWSLSIVCSSLETSHTHFRKYKHTHIYTHTSMYTMTSTVYPCPTKWHIEIMVGGYTRKSHSGETGLLQSCSTPRLSLHVQSVLINNRHSIHVASLLKYRHCTTITQILYSFFLLNVLMMYFRIYSQLVISGYQEGTFFP